MLARAISLPTTRMMERFAIRRGFVARSFEFKQRGFRLRKSFSTASRASIKYRKWTAEEDEKIKNLRKQNLTGPKIAEQLQDRSAFQVRYRLKRLREEKVRFGSSRKPWSKSEDRIMMRMRLEGLKYRQIEGFLPGRNWYAIATRYRQLQNDVPNEERKETPWSAEEKQAILDMKVNGKLSMYTIARKLKRSHESVQVVWRIELRPQLSKETLNNLRPHNGWTAEQDQLLRDLHQKGLCYNQMVIPGKTLKAIYTRAAMLSLPSRRRDRPSPAEAMSIRHALERVLAGETTLEEVHEQFPSSTKRRLIRMLSRLRTGRYKEKDR